MSRLATLAVAALLAAPAGAATVRDCDTYIANARNLATPYDDATRRYAEGRISLLSLLLDEPACCGAHLMVLHPGPDEGFQLCSIVTTEDEMGWSTLDLTRATARYDATRGLTVSIPAREFDGEGFAPFRLDVTVNQATGGVTAAEH